MGDQPEAFAILSPKESIGAVIATSAAPHSEKFGGLRTVGTFEELGGTYQRGINIILARWVYSWKSDEFGIVVRAKARLVARGFGQREGIDFFDTFSPCPSVMSIRLLAATRSIMCYYGKYLPVLESRLR